MKRYVIQIGDKFVRWIQWTAGVEPTVLLDNEIYAMIVNEKYLANLVRNTGKSRRDLIKEAYPDAKFLEVRIEIIQ
jgi:hypothetical protein